jgi:lysophospholipase L1-like esterase
LANTFQFKHPGVINKNSACKRNIFSAAVLCFFVLFLGSCSSPSVQSGKAGSPSLVVQQPPKARLTYVAIGASDTFGLGADDPETQNWASDLAIMLGPGVHLINLGIPGVVLHQALDAEVPVAIDAHPNLITVWLAVNDIGNEVPIDSYAHDLDLLLSRLQAGAPHARIVVGNVPDLRLVPYFSYIDSQTLYSQVQSYNAVIADAVKRHHVILVDIFSRWHDLRRHPEYISGDGFHPSTLGYAKLAELFYQTLKSAR